LNNKEWSDVPAARWFRLRGNWTNRAIDGMIGTTQIETLASFVSDD
jgi:hypothetical protein